MTSERRRQIEEICGSALKRTQGERGVFLDQACGGDAELRREVESRLAGPRVGPGTQLGPYSIVAKLGAGGMGEVYRARDTRLDRTVALKVLPGHLRDDPQLRKRFEREARAVSSLNHPHICTLHDIGSQDGIDYLVMEYLEGETLAQRIAKGPLPPDRVLEYTIQIADALAQAHRLGVLHRDLKPGNIMLTRSGAKLLDFGLAKVRTAVSADDATETDLTGDGTILGTLHYMAPEQLEGKSTDEGSDIFSLGAVLYEMATGRKAFSGESRANVIAAILNAEPPAISTVPTGLDRIVRACLARKPEERWQSARDLEVELRWISAAAEPRERSIPASRPLVWQKTVIGILAVATLILGVLYFRRAVPEAPLRRFSILQTDSGDLQDFTVSPDGTRLAYVSAEPSGVTLLRVRSFDSPAPLTLPGTEGASYPFWSPDSRLIGFFAQGKLKRIAADAQGAIVAQALANAPVPRGGAWNGAGVILFAPKISGDGLYRVPAAGGEVTPVTTLDRSRGEIAHRWPQFLPDENHFLYHARSPNTAEQGIYVGSLDSQDRRMVVETTASGSYVPGPGRNSGWMLFLRERVLLAQPFLLNGFQTAGEPVPLAEGVTSRINRASFSFAGTSLLVYNSGNSSETEMAWVDRTGKPLGAPLPGLEYPRLRLSPDDRRLAYSRIDPATGAGDVWVTDLVRGTAIRITSHAAFDYSPVWSPDGGRVVFATDRDGLMDLYVKDVDGTQPEEPLLRSESRKMPADWSMDGQFIVYSQEDAKTKRDLWALPLSGDRQPIPLARSKFNELQGALSPDGRLLADISDETGKYQVNVQVFGPGGGSPVKWQVSTGGGTNPRWSRDGKELYYVADRSLMAASVKPGPRFETEAPKTLFRLQAPGFGFDERAGEPFAGSSDGKRFLIFMPASKSSATPLTVVLNWAAGLKR